MNPVSAGTTNATTGAPGSATQYPNHDKDISDLRAMSLVELMVAIRCGKYDWLKCLCDPNIRYAHRILDQNFSGREQSVIFGELCGCAVAPPAQPGQPTVPGNFQVPPTQQNSPPPPAACDPSIPAADTWASAAIAGGL